MRKHNDNWTVEEIEYAEDLLKNGFTFDEIAKEINYKFGVHRNKNGVKSKLYKERQHPRIEIPEGKCHWTFKGRPIGKKHWLWKGRYQYN